MPPPEITLADVVDLLKFFQDNAFDQDEFRAIVHSDLFTDLLFAPNLELDETRRGEFRKLLGFMPKSTMKLTVKAGDEPLPLLGKDEAGNPRLLREGALKLRVVDLFKPNELRRAWQVEKRERIPPNRVVPCDVDVRISEHPAVDRAYSHRLFASQEAIPEDWRPYTLYCLGGDPDRHYRWLAWRSSDGRWGGDEHDEIPEEWYTNFALVCFDCE